MSVAGVKRGPPVPEARLDAACSAGAPVIAVLFEAWPAEGQQPRYLDLAAALRPELNRIDGFLSIERFESLAEPGKLYGDVPAGERAEAEALAAPLGHVEWIADEGLFDAVTALSGCGPGFVN